MPRVVTVKARYSGNPDTVFKSAMDLTELQRAMADIAVYEGLPSGPLTEGMTITTNVVFWGWLKVSGHVMHLETYDIAARRVQSREHAPDVKRWDHLLTITPDGDDVLWTDEVVLDAGWKTMIVALFCRYMYRHRHKRRGALTLTSRIQPLRTT